MDLGFARLYLDRRELMELDGNGQNWTGQDSHSSTQWTVADWTGLEYTSAEWTGLSRTALQDWTGQFCTSLDCLSLSLTSPDCTTLHYPGLNWKLPCRTVSSLHLARLICTELRCTFPNETDKDCAALHVNVLHWTRPRSLALHSTGSNLKGLCWIA